MNLDHVNVYLGFFCCMVIKNAYKLKGYLGRLFFLKFVAKWRQFMLL